MECRICSSAIIHIFYDTCLCRQMARMKLSK